MQKNDKVVREQQEKNLGEVNISISKTYSELYFTKKDTRTQLYMIRSHMRRLRGSELTLGEKVATIFRE